MTAQRKNRTFGAAFKQERQDRGLSLANLAKHFSVSRNVIIAWEEGREYPKDSTVIKRIMSWSPRLSAFRLELVHGSPPNQRGQREQSRQDSTAKLGDSHIQFSSFGRALMWLRRQERLNANDLAKLLGCPAHVIGRYEQDENVSQKHLNILYGVFPKLKEAPAPVVQLREAPSKPSAAAEPPAEKPQAKEPEEPPAKSSVQATPPPSPPAFGQALQQSREQARMSTAELAELIEVCRSTVNLWESGRIKPSIERYEKLLELFPELAQVPAPEGLRKMSENAGRKSASSKEEPVVKQQTQDTSNAVMDWTRLLLEAKSDGLAKLRVELLTTLKKDDSDLPQAVARIRDFAELLETAQAANLTLDQVLLLLG